MKLMSAENKNCPWFVTNWAYININPGATVGDEINVIKAMPTFFENGSTIERVYYFSAKDDQGGGRGIPENINVLSKAPQEL